MAACNSRLRLANYWKASSNFGEARSRDWPDGLERLVSTAELSRWLRLPYHEVHNQVLDNILIPEPGEPIQFHLAAKGFRRRHNEDDSRLIIRRPMTEVHPSREGAAPTCGYAG